MPTGPGGPLHTVLPAEVVWAEAFADDPGQDPMAEEAGLVDRAVDRRRREFVTGRRLARAALARLGHPPVPIRQGPGREPIWPDGVVGSITHCDGYRAAAVASEQQIAGLGLDAEVHGRVSSAVADLITGVGERGHLAALAASEPDIDWASVLFSAKESIYKAWFPLTGRWLDHQQAECRFDPSTGVFRATILTDGTRCDGGPVLRQMDGRFVVHERWVMTSVIVWA